MQQCMSQYPTLYDTGDDKEAEDKAAEDLDESQEGSIKQEVEAKQDVETSGATTGDTQAKDDSAKSEES